MLQPYSKEYVSFSKVVVSKLSGKYEGNDLYPGKNIGTGGKFPRVNVNTTAVLLSVFPQAHCVKYAEYLPPTNMDSG